MRIKRNNSKQNHKSLYESIMRDVSKTVKKHLNEDFTDTPHEPYTSNLNIELYLENDLLFWKNSRRSW